MLLALVDLAVGARDRRPPGAPAGARAARSSSSQARAPERAHASTSTRAAARSSTATGRPLAVSVDAESLYAVPQDVDDPRAHRRRRSARALGLDAAGPQGAAGAAPEEPRLRLGAAQGRPRARRARVRELQLDGVGFLTENRRYYPQRELAAHVLGYVGLDNTGMSGDRVRASRRRSAAARRRSWCTPTRGAARSARPSGPRPTGATRGAHPRRGDPARRRERARARRWRRRQAVAGHRGGGRAAHRRGAGDGQPARPSTRTASAPTRARAGGTAPSPTPSSRAASSRSSPPRPALQENVVDARRGARLRQRPDRDRRHRASTTTPSSTTSPSATSIAHSSDIGMIRVAQRLGREQLRALRARLRLRRRRPGSSCPASRRASCGRPPTLERALARLALLRPGDRRHRAADGDGRRGGRQRRLPDEAARRARRSRTARAAC